MATPIFPAMPELSVKTLKLGLSFWMFSIASSTLLAMCVLRVGFQFVSNHIALMVSIFAGWMLNLCMRLWRGVGCHFTSLFVAFLTCLCSGCVIWVVLLVVLLLVVGVFLLVGEMGRDPPWSLSRRL